MTGSCARTHSHVSTVRPKGKSVGHGKRARSYEPIFSGSIGPKIAGQCSSQAREQTCMRTPRPQLPVIASGPIQNAVDSRALNVISDFEKRRSVQIQIRLRDIVVVAGCID